MDEPESDYHNFSQSSEAHRLPTLNGGQALLDAIEKRKPISTRLPTLDSILCESDTATQPDGGVLRGSVTEVYGPPGCGKTQFAIQLTANVLHQVDGAKVVWIDTASRLPYSRLQEFLNVPRSDAAVDEGEENLQASEDAVRSENVDERLHCLYISNLTYLLSVLLHPTPDLIPDPTALLVVDDFSGVVMNGLPQDDRFGSVIPKDDKTSLSRDNIVSKSIATRRAAMLSAISAGLARLAATRNMAIVVLNKATSNLKPGGKNATLRSVLNSQQWNENVATRIVIYRIFWPKVDMSNWSRARKKKQRNREAHALRVAEVERLRGKNVQAEGVKFVILSNRLQAVDPPQRIEVADVTLPSSPPAHTEDNEQAMGNLGLEDLGEEDQSAQMPEDVPNVSALPTSSQPAKRKIAEIADSEDEDEYAIEHTRSRIPRESPHTTGFLPSSQILRDEAGPDKDREKANEDEDASDAGGRDDESDEMLLRD